MGRRKRITSADIPREYLDVKTVSLDEWLGLMRERPFFKVFIFFF